MTSHKTSVAYTKKCLLLPKSPGVPTDLDQPQLALAGCCARVGARFPVGSASDVEGPGARGMPAVRA